jgi:23S rRNA pseudouridine2605 synthase
MIRINRYLALCGLSSRRAAEKIILEARVSVNGQVVRELGAKIDESKDRVLVDGKPVHVQTKKIYVLLNKPKGYVTTVDDEHDRKTVMELIDVRERLVPVGRLDYQSEGLLLLTNDGELVFRLLHPRFKVNKTYYATLKSDFDPKHFDPLTRGVQLEDCLTAPCEAWYYGNTQDRIAVRIHEGKKHQVRRMLAALGYDVKNLRRVQFGPLELGRLRVGEWRFLLTTEVRGLKNAVGLK